MGRISPVYGRDDEIDQVIQTLCGNSTTARRHPLLLGQSGVGKSEIFNGVALRIARGEVPDQLKGKKLYVANSVDLFAGGGFDPMQKMDTVMRRVRGYESYAIFGLDEIQAAFMGEHAKQLSQKLKTILDPSVSGWPYTILATTPSEYAEHVSTDVAFVRRTKNVEVDPLTAEQTYGVLLDQAHTEAAELTVSDDAIRLAANAAENDEFPLFKGASQPLLGKNLLTQAILIARQPKQQEPLQKLKELRKKKGQLDLEYKASFGASSLTYSDAGASRDQRLAEVKAEIAHHEEVIQAADKALKDFQGLIRRRSEFKNALEIEAVHLQAAIEIGQGTSGQLSRFMLKYHFHQLAFEEAIDSQAAKLESFRTEVTPELMRSVMQAEHKRLHTTQQKKIEAVKSEQVKQTRALSEKYRAKYQAKALYGAKGVQLGDGALST